VSQLLEDGGSDGLDSPVGVAAGAFTRTVSPHGLMPNPDGGHGTGDRVRWESRGDREGRRGLGVGSHSQDGNRGRDYRWRRELHTRF